MPDDPTPDPKPDPAPDPDAGAKKALEAERKARRDAEKEAADLKARLDDLEGKDKSELQKLTDRVSVAEKRAADAEAKALRFEVAAEKGVKPRWLQGATREELEAAADEYLTDHPPANSGQPAPTKPAEDLRGGGDPTQEPDVDVRSVVDSIPRGV